MPQFFSSIGRFFSSWYLQKFSFEDGCFSMAFNVQVIGIKFQYRTNRAFKLPNFWLYKVCMQAISQVFPYISIFPCIEHSNRIIHIWGRNWTYGSRIKNVYLARELTVLWFLKASQKQDCGENLISI